MKRINDRTVELTDKEQAAEQSFHHHLRSGHTIADAARIALIHHRLNHPRDDEFIDWLSEGRVERRRNTIKVKPEYRETTTAAMLSAEEMRRRLGLVPS
jgi:hypothetical protein